MICLCFATILPYQHVAKDRFFFELPGFCRTGGLNRPSGHPTVRSVSFSKYIGCYAGQPGTASGRNAPRSPSFIKPRKVAAE